MCLEVRRRVECNYFSCCLGDENTKQSQTKLLLSIILFQSQNLLNSLDYILTPFKSSSFPPPVQYTQGLSMPLRKQPLSFVIALIVDKCIFTHITSFNSHQDLSENVLQLFLISILWMSKPTQKVRLVVQRSYKPVKCQGQNAVSHYSVYPLAPTSLKTDNIVGKLYLTISKNISNIW